jgi:hypothetical protein
MGTTLRNFGIGLAMVLGAAAGAAAAPISGLGDPLGHPALAGGTQEGFDAVPAGQYFVLALGNVTYSSTGDPFDVDGDFNGSFNNIGGQSVSNDFYLVPDNFRFDFAAPVSAFAFNWGASDNSWLLSAFDAGNNLLETLVVPPVGSSNAGEYFGINTAGISYATLIDQKNNLSGDYIFIDRFTTSAAGVVAAPEPATMLLFGAGLASLGIRRRTRRS